MKKQIKKAEQLNAYVWEDTKSINLMDEFEGIGTNNNIRYERLVFTNRRMGLTQKGKSFNYRLVVERRKPGSEVAGNITFTEFKKGYTSELRQHVNASVNEKEINKYSGKNDIFYFKKPFRFRAQNSTNRMGYGWSWDWSNGYGDYTEGTYYGETTEYVFAGVYID